MKRAQGTLAKRGTLIGARPDAVEYGEPPEHLGEALVNRTAAQALTAALAPTRWMIEHCDSLGTAGCLIYHQNALWALRRIVEVWKGEITPVIAVSGGRVVYRAVRLDAQRGSWRGLRFTYGKKLSIAS